MDYVDCIENAITDYCIKNKVSPKDIPFSIFELSIHINDFVNIKKREKPIIKLHLSADYILDKDDYVKEK